MVIQMPINRRKTSSMNSMKTMILYLTGLCNLQCNYCFVEDRIPAIMNMDVAKESLHWLCHQKSKRLTVNFFGGEPLMCVDLIKEIVVYGKQLAEQKAKKIRFGLTSNGTLLTNDIVDFFNEYKIGLHFSIDGAPYSQDKYRRTMDNKGTSDILEDKIKIMSKMWKMPSVRMTVTPETGQYLFDNINYLIGSGFRRISPVAIFDTNWSDKAFQALKEEWYRVAGLYVYQVLKNDPLYLKYITDAIKFLEGKQSKKHPCGAGRSMLAVAPSGEVYPCHRFIGDKELRSFKLGSVGEIKSEIQQKFKNLTIKKMNGCKELHLSNDQGGCSNCNMISYCGGGCPAINAKNKHSLMQPVDSMKKFYHLYLDVANRAKQVMQ